MTSFLLSVLLKRRFLILSETPLPLTGIFAPTFPDLADWRTRMTSVIPDHLEYIDARQRFHQDVTTGLLFDLFAKDESPEYVTISINQLMLESVLAARSFPIPDLRAVSNLFGGLFKFLFSPTRTLVESAASLMRESDLLGKSIIGIHLRVGAGHGQTWYDPVRHSMTDLPSFIACAQSVDRSVGGHNHFLLTGDVDASVLELELRRLNPRVKDKFHFLNGTVSHIDRSDDIETQIVHGGFIHSWATWWILAEHSAGLVLSRSGFGETAAKVRGLAPNLTRYFMNCTLFEFS
jgi:hypothetical protein